MAEILNAIEPLQRSQQALSVKAVTTESPGLFLRIHIAFAA